MIMVTFSEQEAQALMQLMQFVVQRGCDMGAAEAAIVIHRKVAESVNKVSKGNGRIEVDNAGAGAAARS